MVFSDVPIPLIALRLLRSILDNMMITSDRLGAVTLPPLNASCGELTTLPPTIRIAEILTLDKSTFFTKE